MLLGWPAIFFGLVVGILLGGVAGFFYLSVKFLQKEYNSDLAMPYGPYLVASAVILLYLGNYLLP